MTSGDDREKQTQKYSGSEADRSGSSHQKDRYLNRTSGAQLKTTDLQIIKEPHVKDDLVQTNPRTETLSLAKSSYRDAGNGCREG